MKALVTGGAGFIGSHLVDALVADGHEVCVVDDLSTGKESNVNPRAHLRRMDVTDPRVRGTMLTERPEVVFHLAAQASVKASMDDVSHDASVNVLGLVNVLEACVVARVRHVVFASSGATYGNPDYLPLDEGHPQRPESPYGITKLVAEHYLRYYARDRGLSFTALRYGNVYGPRQDPFGEAGVVAIFTQQLLTGQIPVIHWDGEQVRDYVYVGDVVRANLRAAEVARTGICCIGTGTGTTVNDLYRTLCDAIGTYVEPRRAERRPGDLRAAFFDTSRAEAELGWLPQIPLRDGLAETVAYARNALSPQPVSVAS
jgi:UDP-glucose 4-epimerase